MLSLTRWRHDFLQTLPVMFGYLPLGAAFGILFVQLGHPWWVALLMSLFIYAGAGQFMAITLLANHAGLLEVAVATFMLNSRHLFYGLSLLKRFQGAGWRKPYLIFALTDETYSLLTNQGRQQHGPEDHASACRISLMNQLWWVMGTLAGAVAGATIAFDSRGIEFALTALFIVLTLEQASRLRRALPFAIALFTGLGALALLPERHLLLGAIGTTSLILLAHYRWLDRHQETCR
ncbi:4-azaleucine resistance probable transporter AzlC [Modicisalibacter ilicicola DSM 19980]|uniref:4-azaleucine resistance probable transporter AzlC n=1 Tax=Modicisalibacter ilicicola DSM 19980 TaxID=1121942 RepID=A0A1M4XJ73_9GAMM|nr:AzlC family ABC transporter permease [Halomonas ilicicola]SHE93549.1 4-azaleucine resistance probable transporter AzlC [Halomonas ilicicola DSM 19980]